MIDRTHRLGVGRQAKARSGSAGAASITCRGRPRTPISRSCAGLDELHLDRPFAGSRMHQVMLKAKSYEVGRLHVSTLMKKMGVEALYRRPKTTKPAPGHKVYPYLLRNLAVIRPNQVSAMNTTCVPMARGVGIGLEPVATDASLYLAAVIDWYSRRVLASAVDHAFGRLLHRGARGGAGPPRTAGHLQQ
jgi:putative transposase